MFSFLDNGKEVVPPAFLFLDHGKEIIRETNDIANLLAYFLADNVD